MSVYIYPVINIETNNLVESAATTLIFRTSLTDGVNCNNSNITIESSIELAGSVTLSVPIYPSIELFIMLFPLRMFPTD